MKLGFGTYALMLSIVLYGILLGGIVYSHIVYFPVYLSHLPESAVLVNGPYGLEEGYFWVTIHPLAILSLIVSLAANWRDRFRRKMIAMPLAVYIFMMVVTSLYFVPELGEFKHSPESNVSSAEWKARGDRWQHLSWIRGTTMGLFSIPLLLALAKPRDEAR
jgi:hypothetical protein